MARKKSTSPTLPYMQLTMYQEGQHILTVSVPKAVPLTQKKMTGHLKVAETANRAGIALTLVEVAKTLVDPDPLFAAMFDQISEVLILAQTPWQEWEDKIMRQIDPDYPF